MSEQLKQYDIENRIFEFRDLQIMVDRDLAEMYQVDTKVLNQAVKRNIDRFPDYFRFQLTDAEKNELVTNCDRFVNLKHSTSNPYAFTEQGVAMLSAVLRSETAVKVSIQIINTFVKLRKSTSATQLIDHRLSTLEKRQIETNQKFEQVFDALENKPETPQQGVFFEGQIFDAYTFIAEIIRKAKKDIILIDNYVDDTVLTLLDKRKAKVTATIYTQKIENQLQLDIKKHNAQYPAIEVKKLNTAHDRFLIIDQEEMYHIGASLKDAGKKWFAFSKMNHLTETVLKQLGK